MANIECNDCKNANCLIKKCNSNTCIKLKKNQSNYKKNQHIFHQGTPVYGVYFIQNGKVKVTNLKFNGGEQIVRFATDGNKLSHAEFEHRTYPNGAVAIEDSSICFIENQTIKNLFTEDAEFTFEVMKFYSKEFLKIEQRIKSLTQMTIEEKISFSLLEIIDIFGLSENENEINIILSRKEIADIVGTNADQVSRTISYLKQKKVINTIGKRIFLTDYNSLKNSLSRYSLTSLN